MKIILLQDVAKIGRRFEEKNVADGFARNSLIPSGKAMIASPANLKRITFLQASKDKGVEAMRERIKKAISDLKSKPIVIRVKANEKGHLFAGLDASHLSDLINTQAGIVLPKEAIVLLKPIKEIGEHELTIRFGDMVAVILITIEAEN